jgi:hypothetical protein
MNCACARSAAYSRFALLPMGMVLHRDNSGGLGDGKCIYLEDSEVDRYTEKKDSI